METIMESIAVQELRYTYTQKGGDAISSNSTINLIT